jgi:hypothetical protein
MPRRLGLMLAMAALLTALPLRAPAAASSAGLVVGVAGRCVAETGGVERPLKLGDPIAVGDTLVVPAAARLKLRLSAGSVISVASGTRLTITAYAAEAGHREARLSLAGGLLRAVVSAVAGPSRFEVDTATGTAAVRSTDWFVEAKPGSMQVGVLAGSVSLESRATGREVTIPARWGARLEAGRDPVPPRLWTPEEFANVISRTTLH